MSLPTTKAELEVWLPKQLEQLRPDLKATQRTLMARAMIDMAKSDYEAKTLAEGFEAARTGNVDPERAASSIRSMRENGRI